MGFKVVINKCYGGFGVSEKGIEWLLANGANPTKVNEWLANPKVNTWPMYGAMCASKIWPKCWQPWPTPVVA